MRIKDDVIRTSISSALVKNQRKTAHKQRSTERPFECPEPDCDKTFKMKDAYTNHIKQVHSTERPFKCPDPGCDKANNTPISFTQPVYDLLKVNIADDDLSNSVPYFSLAQTISSVHFMGSKYS